MFGDGAWATSSLRRLLAQGHSCAAVVLRTRPSEEGLAEFARSLGIDTLTPAKASDPSFVKSIAEIQPDLNLSISYNQILRRPLLETARLGFVNFHAGMLPRYRGRNVINWAIINGETEVGLTSHFVDEGIDTGDIILQRSLPIAWNDTYGDVLTRVVAAIPDLVGDTVDAFRSGNLTRIPQDHTRATYMPGRMEGDEWIDWSDSSLRIYNFIRGISRPGPGARALLNGRRVVFWRVQYDPGWPTYLATPGAVVGRTAEGVIVKTGDATIAVLEAEVEGETPSAPCWPIGTRLTGGMTARLLAVERRSRIHGDAVHGGSHGDASAGDG